MEAKSGEQQQQKKKGAVADADETKAKAKRSLLGEGSKANQGEVDLVHQYVHILLTQGTPSRGSNKSRFIVDILIPQRGAMDSGMQG